VVIVEMVKEFAGEEAFVFGVRKGFSDYGFSFLFGVRKGFSDYDDMR